MKLSVRMQLAGFALAVVLVAILVVWTEYTSWRQLVALREHFSTVQIDSFHFAEHLKVTTLDLNRTLLRFDGRESPADREKFLRESRALIEWLQANKTNATTQRERELLEQIETAFVEYAAQARQVMAQSAEEPGSDLWRVFQTLAEKSAPVLDLSDELAAAHREALNAFVTDSHESIVWLHRLLAVSLILFLALGGSLTLMVYRGIFAPMRTELDESHAIIARQEKLSALGVLAAGVAHEIRNPLTAVKVRLHSLNRAVKDDPSASEDVSIASAEISRLDRIVKDFLQFARPSDPQFVVLPADGLLRAIYDLMKGTLDRNAIELRLEAHTSDPVRVDPQQIQQVLINLVKNASESIGRDGVVTLRARAVSRGSRADRASGVILDVSDTGKGIPPEVQRRLFDPFFSTKETGTGLGLSIAARIVEKHGGTLEYQTQTNRGTTFSIVLPGAGNEGARDHQE